jgi:hypothetical protein
MFRKKLKKILKEGLEKKMLRKKLMKILKEGLEKKMLRKKLMRILKEGLEKKMLNLNQVFNQKKKTKKVEEINLIFI